MGWGRFFLLGDIGQQLDISDARAELDRERRSRAQSQIELREQIARLDEENDQLKLALTTIIHALRSRQLLNDVELAALVRTLEPSAQPTDTSDALEALADAQRQTRKPGT